MSYIKSVHRILLSYPKSLEKEKNIIVREVERMNLTLKDDPYGFELFTWEEDVAINLTLRHPQEQIDEKFDYQNSDIMIVLFNNRLTPGTKHELDKAIESMKKSQYPSTIIVYFKNLSPLTEKDSPEIHKEFKRLDQYKKKIQNKGITGKFSDAEELRESFVKQLNQYHMNLLKNRANEYPQYVVASQRISGFEKYEGWWLEVISDFEERPYSLCHLMFNSLECRYEFWGRNYYSDNKRHIDFKSEIVTHEPGQKKLFYLINLPYKRTNGYGKLTFAKVSVGDDLLNAYGYFVDVHDNNEAKIHDVIMVKIDKSFVEFFCNSKGVESGEIALKQIESILKNIKKDLFEAYINQKSQEFSHISAPEKFLIETAGEFYD